jgi:hypothetical protein
MQQKSTIDLITRRGWTVIWILVLIIGISFGYATRDICYVGEKGNFLGYGSCSKMIDDVIGGNK